MLDLTLSFKRLMLSKNNDKYHANSGIFLTHLWFSGQWVVICGRNCVRILRRKIAIYSFLATLWFMC